MKSIHALCYSSSGEKRQHLNYVASQARATLVVVSARAGPTSPTHDDGGTTSACRVELASSGPERGVYRGVDGDKCSAEGPVGPLSRWPFQDPSEAPIAGSILL